MHLYVHIPFCASKCPYCAFYSITDAPKNFVRDYPRLLARELDARGLADAAFETLYVGGGTPSLLGADGIRRLFDALRGAAPKLRDAREITVELNPADVTPALSAALAECGATRASLGAQSFDDATLRILGRRHDAAAAREAASALRHAGVPALSLDLICAVTGAPSAAFAQSLESAAALAPEHISVYPLSIEQGARFAAQGFAPASDDAAMNELAAAEDFFSERGYERYEISNYRKIGAPGCLHNLAVWQGADYAGIGPAAASRLGLERRVNAADAASYFRNRADSLQFQSETLAPEEDERERFATGLRLSSGISPDPATTRGRDQIATCERFVRVGLMRRIAAASLTPGAAIYALTRRGREVADGIAAELP